MTDFRLWKAKERVRHAENYHKDMVESLNRTKTRAASLLGWAVTLGSASIVAASQSGRFKSEAILSAFGFIGVGALCIRCLYSSNINWLSLDPHMFDSMLEQAESESEVEALEGYAHLAREVFEANAVVILRDQKNLKRAWWAFFLTPILVGLLFILSSLFRAAR